MLPCGRTLSAVPAAIQGYPDVMAAAPAGVPGAPISARNTPARRLELACTIVALGREAATRLQKAAVSY